ncbi:Cysteine desulfurase activator SufB [Methanonatronarchaeum thermophilum]|uniref:Cysteine desulfurase activator SufB n=1 Tax=Methanonatronarchaeum thermophilum TaxID=1927129 RepID=A0A1Y3GAV0_9EURY|nr:SufD family Fe-S cluster assembly protein [Methanonatronarchaeum thermophilum]OUJ18581.1 Cysteine desulfurase activator SufB [Methanonatronarchaeum thermophilum]
MLSDRTELRIKDRAEEYRDVPAKYGPDIDLSKFQLPKHKRKNEYSIENVKKEFGNDLSSVGIDLDQTSGSYVQVDGDIVYQKMYDDIEVLSIDQALKKHDLTDYYWNAVKINDKYSARVEKEMTGGYFIRVPKGVKKEVPTQTCLLQEDEKATQNVHNIIIVEEGAELHVITGCSKTKGTKEGLHLGVSEFYLEKDAKLTFTMIHNWGENHHVRPRTAVKLKDNATFINNYVLVSPVKSIQSYPTAYCNGKNSKASFQTVVYAKENSNMDLGSQTVLRGKGSKSDMISRSISRDKSNVTVRGRLVGEEEDIQGHLECKGIILSDQSNLLTIPELEAKKSNLDLSHEAAVGKIKEEQLNYLMSRGLTEEEAVSLIIKGFMTIDIKGLPPDLTKKVEKMIDMTVEKAI